MIRPPFLVSRRTRLTQSKLVPVRWNEGRKLRQGTFVVVVKLARCRSVVTLQLRGLVKLSLCPRGATVSSSSLLVFRITRRSRWTVLRPVLM